MAIQPKKHEMPVQEAKVRAHNFKEVALGYTPEIAVAEAQRCLNCKNKPCVDGCPVNISIPEFISIYFSTLFFIATSSSYCSALMYITLR